jgi:hypothetical protein
LGDLQGRFTRAHSRYSARSLLEGTFKRHADEPLIGKSSPA